jgi:RNA recognition motif-containing protein
MMNECSGIAFVTFLYHDDAEDAVEDMDEYVSHLPTHCDALLTS